MCCVARWKLPLWITLVVASCGGLIVNSALPSDDRPTGPSFLMEPPSRVTFYNSTGALVPCTVQGDPRPDVHWVRASTGLAVRDVPGVVTSRADGTLSFAPFRAQDYRQDLHAATYRCVASNAAGSVGSRDVQVRAIIRSAYEVTTSDVFVIRGNTAALRCEVPASVRDFIHVVYWETDDGLTLHSGTLEDKYQISTEGDLVIDRVDMADARRKYRCITRNILVGETVSGSSWAQLLVTDTSNYLPPRIRRLKQTVKLSAGDPLRLACVAQGYPTPSYRWYRKKESLTIPLGSSSGSGGRIRVYRGFLLVQSTMRQDAGTFVCVANNTAGEDRALFEVIVTMPLKVTVSPSSVLTREGRTVVFNCSVRGFPVSAVTWLRNQQPVMPGGRVRVLDQTELHVSAVQRSDRGMYQCVAYGHESSAQGAAQLALEENPPDFLEAFQDQLLKPGLAVSLKCSVTGNPLPQISWFRYGRLLADRAGLRIGDFVDASGVVTSFVNVSAVATEHGGVYTCRAENELASAEHTARLSVYGPPFVHRMDNATHVSGADVRVQCASSGYPISQVVWKKDNEKLRPSSRILASDNGTLHIVHVTQSDQGWYECAVSNRRGNTAIGSMYLRVIARPVINPFLFMKNLQEGMRTTVVCSVLSGESPMDIDWLKDGAPLSDIHPEAKITRLGDFASSLTMDNVTRRHSGNYSCKVTSGIATANYTARMDVSASPRWMKQPSDQSCTRGQRTVFDCEADGNPLPVHRWKVAYGKRSEKVSEFRSVVSSPHMHVLENGSLVISEVTIEDQGHYLCEASNGVGPALSVVAYLDVNVPPYFTEEFETKTVRSKDDVTISCEVFGETPLTVTWSKDRKPFGDLALPRFVLQEDTTAEGIVSKVFIPSVSREDSGVFACEATNSYGKKDRTIQLIVQGAPEIPRDVHIDQVTSRSVTLYWTQPHTGNSPILGYTILYVPEADKVTSAPMSMRTGTPSNRATLTGLIPGTSYILRIVAENAVGKSGPSEEVRVSTDEEAPSGSPYEVRVTATSSKTIHVRWKPPLQATYHGQLKGFHVGYRPINTRETFQFQTLKLDDSEHGVGQEKKEQEYEIRGLRRHTQYAVVVQAFNNKGAGPLSEEATVQTLEFDPPPAPQLFVTSKSSSTLELQWKFTEATETPITGYVVHYKSEYGEWQETQVNSKLNKHLLTNLVCGHHYQITVTAFNSAGRGAPSDTVSAETTGRGPIPPQDKMQNVVTANSTCISVNLDGWSDGGCPITSFVLQYKPHMQQDWILLSNNIQMAQSPVTLTDLAPGTWYDIMVSAYNDADANEVEYRVATLTLSGATVAPLAAQSQESGGSLFRDPAVLVPVACAVVVVLVICLVVGVVIVLRRRENVYDTCHTQHIYSSESVRKTDSMSMSAYTKDKQHFCDSSGDEGATQREPLYYPSPYATTQVSAAASSALVAEEMSSCTSPGRRLASGGDFGGGGGTLQRTRYSGNRTHLYDVPLRPKQSEDYTAYARLWMQPLPTGAFSVDQDGETDMYADFVEFVGSETKYSRTGEVPHYRSPRKFSKQDVLMNGEVMDMDELSEAECDRDRLRYHMSNQSTLARSQRDQSLYKHFAEVF
ncbi:cell adhesion molecule Dscam1-like isoform X2 [Rhipicephalus microplus]|uniref:cell adhesion molecule Dscam1-like isoform X2 n=1 Tax=Rhipicephalus microplus TaxID=6941 RepID=UPI003F6D926E